MHRGRTAVIRGRVAAKIALVYIYRHYIQHTAKNGTDVIRTGTVTDRRSEIGPAKRVDSAYLPIYIDARLRSLLMIHQYAILFYTIYYMPTKAVQM